MCGFRPSISAGATGKWISFGIHYMYPTPVDPEAQTFLIKPLAEYLQKLAVTADTNFGEQTSERLKDELIMCIDAAS